MFLKFDFQLETTGRKSVIFLMVGFLLMVRVSKYAGLTLTLMVANFLMISYLLMVRISKYADLPAGC